MRHGKEGRKFSRKTGQRRHFLRNLVNDLIRSGRIETTEARAKSIRPAVEKLVTKAKKQDLASRRLIIARLHNKATAQRLVEEIAPRYLERNGGYTRIVKLSKFRKRDAAPVAIIEFV